MSVNENPMFMYISKLIKEGDEDGGAAIQIITPAGAFIGAAKHHPDISGLFLFTFPMKGEDGITKLIDMTISAESIVSVTPVDLPPSPFAKKPSGIIIQPS